MQANHSWSATVSRAGRTGQDTERILTRHPERRTLWSRPMKHWIRIGLCIVLLNCTGCRLISQTINYALNLAVQLIPFLLLVAIDEDGNGEPEETRRYVVWLDPAQGSANVHGADESLHVHAAERVDGAWRMHVIVPETSQHLEILAPDSGEPVIGATGTVQVTAQQVKTWSRNAENLM